MAVVAAAAMMSCSVLSVGACGCRNSSKHNAEDSVYSSLEIKGNNQYYSKMNKLGNIREKKTDTSVYFYCWKTSSEAIKMQVAVSGITNKNSTNPKYNNTTLNSRGNRVEWVTCSAYAQYEIFNRVKEDGYIYCDLKVDHNGGEGTKRTYGFNWSPDTCPAWGSYPVASVYQPLQ